MHHDITEEPARRDRTRVHILCLGGPAENMNESSPARKSNAHEIRKKTGRIPNIFELPWPVKGDIKKRHLAKPSQVKLILSPKQRANPKTSARKTGSEPMWGRTAQTPLARRCGPSAYT